MLPVAERQPPRAPVTSAASMAISSGPGWRASAAASACSCGGTAGGPPSCSSVPWLELKKTATLKLHLTVNSFPPCPSHHTACNQVASIHTLQSSITAKLHPRGRGPSKLDSVPLAWTSRSTPRATTSTGQSRRLPRGRTFQLRSLLLACAHLCPQDQEPALCYWLRPCQGSGPCLVTPSSRYCCRSSNSACTWSSSASWSKASRLTKATCLRRR